MLMSCAPVPLSCSTAVSLLLALLAATAVPHVVALDNGVGRRPPMAWSSWNRFFYEVNATVIVEMAHAMVDGGYKALGYE